MNKRWILAIGVVLGLLSSGLLIGPYLLFREAGDWSQVVSIEKDARYKDTALLAKAFMLPVAAAYQKGGLDYQRNPSFCGPTTAVDVERSFGTAIDQAHILDGTRVHTTFGVVWGGLTLDEEAEMLLEKTHRKVTVLRDLDLASFRAELAHANDPARRYTVNFSRGPLFGRGGGHHSPVGAYLAAEDLVLVLDVNNHFQPWLVTSERLWQAVNTVDKASGKKRGLLLIQ